MGFTIEKEYAARRGTQTAAQKEKRRRARKRASGRAAIRKLESDPRLKSIEKFMGKVNYGGMPNSTSQKPLSIDKEFRKKN